MPRMMEWIPTVFVTFKFLVLGTGMFFAVKWHYDKGRKKKQISEGAVLRAGGIAAAVFTLALLGLGFITFALINILGL